MKNLMWGLLTTSNHKYSKDLAIIAPSISINLTNHYTWNGIHHAFFMEYSSKRVKSMNTNSATIIKPLHWFVLVGILEQITYIYFKININSYINITFELGQVGFVSGDNSTGAIVLNCTGPTSK